MKKHLPIYIYGFIIILVGAFLFISKNSSFEIIKITLGISLIIVAIFAFITAFSRQKQQVQFAYHELHALGMLAYGISIMFLCNSLEKLIAFTSFLFIFYAFSEIIFCNWLFNLGQKIVYKILAIRALLGLSVGFGTIAAMHYTDYTLQVFGALFIMVGVNIILYVPVMKANQTIETPKEV